MAVLAVPFFLTFLDNTGKPLAGGSVLTLAAGTSDLKATFTDFSEVTQAENPVVLDSAGRATIWINGSYDFQLFDALGNLVKTTQNVTSFSVPAASASAYFQTFSGTNSQTVFTLSEDLGTDENAVLVFVDAGDGKGYEIQNPSVYTLNDSGTITISFATAPATGTNNIYIFAPSTLLGAASAAAAAAATSEANASGSASAAAASASAAAADVILTDADVSLTHADVILTHADVALTHADVISAAASSSSASTSATNAAASAVLAGTALTATSTTSNTIGTGNFNFTVQANKNFFANQNIIAGSAGTPAAYIHGIVASYSGTTLVITETDNGGSGTFTDWNISVSGTKGKDGAGTGTVTSVGLTMPAEFGVASSPVTASGVIAVSKANQNANIIYAGPSSGAAAAPAFRSIVVADVPTLNQSTTGNAATSTTAGNLSGTPTLPNGTSAATQAAHDNSSKLANTAYADRVIAWDFDNKAAPISFINGTAQTVAHGLGVVPSEFVAYIVCVTAQGTIAVGDMYNISFSGTGDNGANNPTNWQNFKVDNTNFTIQPSSNGFLLNAIIATAANFRIILKARK